MSNLVEFARKELEMAGLFDSDSDYDGGIGKAVMELIEVFAKQEHSEKSAVLCASILCELLSYLPLSPLTGEDNEWIEVKEGLWQNKRWPTVFKDDKHKMAYDINGKVFVDKDGISYTSRESIVYITFPYYPKTEYIYEERE